MPGGSQVVERRQRSGLSAVDQVGVAWLAGRRHPVRSDRSVGRLERKRLATLGSEADEVEQQRQRPGGDVVEARVLAAIDARPRLLEERLRQGLVRLEQRADQPVARLCGVDDERTARKATVVDRGAGSIAQAADGDLLRQARHLDPVPLEQRHQLGSVLRIAARWEQVVTGSARAVVHRLTMGLVVAGQKLRASLGGQSHGGPRRRVLLTHRVAQPPHGLVGAVQRQPTRRALLVQHADGALIAAVRGRVAGIEVVVALAGHVLEARRVERFGIGSTEVAEPLLGVARKVRAVGVGRRIEVELDVGAHLVGVDDDLRSPGEQGRHAMTGLPLRVGEPVPVGVEVVVARPELQGLPAVEVVGPVVP